MNLDPDFLHIKSKYEGCLKSLLKFRGDKTVLKYMTEIKQLYTENPSCRATTFLSINFIHTVCRVLKKCIQKRIVDQINVE